jgi:SulP family sulfate permease
MAAHEDESNESDSSESSKSTGRIGGLIGGFVAGLYSVPEGIGYAQLAGINPMYGIYAGMAPVALAAMFTGSVLMMSTFTSAIALTMSGVLTDGGFSSDEIPQAVFTLSLLVGVFMTVLGLLGLGKVVNFVSNAVMTGFVMGVAVLITVGKFDDIFGYKPTGISNKVVQALDILVHPGDWDTTTAVVGFATIAAVFALKAISALERYALVIVVFAGTLVVWMFGIDTKTIADIATIPSGLDAVPIPTSTADLPDLSMIVGLAAGAFSITLVALAQGAGIRPAFPNPDGSRSSSSRDFLGQGIGNLAGSLFQAAPTGGSLSRTAVSADGGARSRFAGYVAAATVLILVVVLSPVVSAIPSAVIGGLLFVIGIELVMGRMPDARLAWRAGRRSMLLFVVTLALTLTVPLQWAILGGAVLSLAAFVVSSSNSRAVQVYGHDDVGWFLTDDVPATVPTGVVTVVRLAGDDFFAEVPALIGELPAAPPENAGRGALVLDLANRQTFSSTTLKALKKYHAELAAGGHALVLVGASPQLRETLERTGFLDIVGVDNVLGHDPHLGADRDAGARRAQELLS